MKEKINKLSIHSVTRSEWWLEIAPFVTPTLLKESTLHFSSIFWRISNSTELFIYISGNERMTPRYIQEVNFHSYSGCGLVTCTIDSRFRSKWLWIVRLNECCFYFIITRI